VTATTVVRLLLIVCAMFAAASPSFAQPDPHAGHQQEKPKPSAPAKPATEGAHDHSKASESPKELPPFIPRTTDEDRRAAFPDVQVHAVHDNAVTSYVLFDQLEWQAGDGASGINVDTKGWIGRDRDRFWFRAEGDSEDGRVGDAAAHVLYGRQFSRWWDVVGGIRQDVRPGPARTWAAIGVQGLAPYWFEVEVTAYVGESGRTQARFEVEYELLLTNRLVLQPLIEVDLFGKSDPERGIGAGLSTTDIGFRLRYEFRREFAPYIGVTWNRKYGKTADFAEAASEGTGGARVVTGLRLWF
jgi:copper resistance protein B